MKYVLYASLALNLLLFSLFKCEQGKVKDLKLTILEIEKKGITAEKGIRNETEKKIREVKKITRRKVERVNQESDKGVIVDTLNRDFNFLRKKNIYRKAGKIN